ncbi:MULTISPECIES: transcription antitermination factor NusB [Acinetobacter]|jgi:N utilization substance protein B|uniref:Transcription antitermination protein NusB n=1 Tax=Acinetobacter brisouii CIP 110357 TaxID=1341683 RepID=V2U883_9GAMM|nr:MULTISPECIES: transcription antitermination factor NusB [Acinetobacter]ENU81917.1 transcription antitermination factor NusB [Acinetobacter sp. ANC 3789]ENV47281.1 transcription antitermination factor NusB [Acinetobacter brisouii ANC 4119]ESK50583.1 transcription antitermination factor NusB [Acinetobacter brisouii CIP 110357]KJV39681.1 antitermination protein NusB [Acinetobacter brisouii]TCB27177.1 transcription antitermination factor NusB [Acinetobacter sp. ANC 4633]
MSQTLQAIYAAKRKARRFAVQGVYEWQMSHNPVHEIEARTRAENAMHKVDLNYYHELLTQIVAEHETLDELLIPVLDREIDALDGVELATLRLGAYELRHHAEIPYRVVLDEAIELAKHFGGADSHKYINGVLDRLAHVLREAEKQQG